MSHCRFYELSNSHCGSYVKLNNADLIVDTDPGADGYSDGNHHRIFSVDGEKMHQDGDSSPFSDEELGSIEDDLARGKFTAYGYLGGLLINAIGRKSKRSAFNTPPVNYTEKPKFSVGDFVATINYGYLGRINRLQEIPDAAWVRLQKIKVRSVAKKPGYPWYSILVDGGGSVSVAEYDIVKVKPFNFSNPYWKG